MPTPLTLIDSIAEKIEAIVGLYRFPESDDDSQERAPRVFRQHLPAKRYEGVDTADYPFVVVSLADLEIAELAEVGGQPTAEVIIVCGGYDASDDYQGWRIPTEIATRIIHELQRDPILGAFSLDLPLSMSFPEVQPTPQWLALIYTRWKLPSTSRITPHSLYGGMWGETTPRREI